MKKKIYKYSTTIQKCAHNKLHNIISKYNDTYHRIIKMKSTEVKKSTYFDFDVTSNEKDPKFKVDAYVRISECKSIFTKGCTPNW